MQNIRYYQWKSLMQDFKHAFLKKHMNHIKEPEKTPPNQLLKKEEEDFILKAILDAQLGSECLCGADIRNIAEELYKNRTQLFHLQQKC